MRRFLELEPVMNLDLMSRLKELHNLTAQTPLFNPVSQLGLELSREIEAEKINLDTIEGIISKFECDALQTRARKLHSLLAPVEFGKNLEIFDALLEKSAKNKDFKSFCEFWSSPLLHAVFTAHPTFLLNASQSESVANAASSGDVTSAICEIRPTFEDINLDYEHKAAMGSIERAAIARSKINKRIIAFAKQYYEQDFTNILPSPFKFATWVGYDMDGRTDIGWHTSLRYRLLEKAAKLNSYISELEQIGLKDIARKLEKAFDKTIKFADELGGFDLSPAAISEFANRFTSDTEKLISLKPIIEELLIKARNDKEKEVEILSLASAMKTDGLGMGEIHFRLNSAQLNNAIRSQIQDFKDWEINSATALKQLQKLIKDTKPQKCNFAALAIESTTAIRQFLLIAQILKHIDSDASIRLLIAECEQPQTVLIALYFAKLLGIDDKIDISPLFETESAMEHGARFLDALLGDPNYRQYAKKRGRVAIQTGFSDAGRFVGQIPAALAIERLHGRLARFMALHDLSGVKALIFNTHGESMGRGAHPSSIKDRLTYPMSEWARHQFRVRKIKTELEVSFQGGDGYIFFGSDELALASLVRIAQTSIESPEAVNDPFYKRTDLTLDFYRGIRRVQREYLANSAYSRAISAFGLGLLKTTGSRRSRRQSDIASDKDMSLRQIRAIPHNAILQQLGYPVNVIAGTGTAAKDNLSELAELIASSPRGLQIMRLLESANSLASIKTLAAYGDLFNCAYWASRPYRGTEMQLENACLALAERLEYDDRPGEIRRLASSLRVDGLRYHRLSAKLELKTEKSQREEIRRSLGVLHALRLCLMQHIFLRAVQIPAFSRRNDISRDDILEMIFSLRIDDALELLRRAFPANPPSIDDFKIEEPTDYPTEQPHGYEAIHREYFDRIDRAYQLILRIGVAIANHFGAHG